MSDDVTDKLDSVPPPKKKRQYHVSRAEQAKRDARKKVAAQDKAIAKAKKQIVSAKKKKNTIKKVSGAVSGSKPSALTPDDLDTLPPRAKAEVEEEQVIFKPNEGPQTDFLAAPEKEVLYGGAAGGGKSYAMLADLLRYAHHSDYRALLLRRTLGELTELIDKSRELYPKAFPGAKFREAKSTWVFPSGATALFSYVDRDQDVSRYQGQAFAWIGIDELGHYPTPYVWNYLRSRLRTTNPAITTYMRGSANPGGLGGWWLKKMFIDPTTPGEPFWAEDMDTKQTLVYGPHHEKAGEPLFHRRFIPARLTDNPYLLHSDDYEAMLMSLPEVERRRLLEGDWDVAEGAAFSEFSRATHVVEPFDIPPNWTRIRGGDYGYASPSCILWGAVDWDGNIIVYRELYEAGLTGEALANRILEMEANDPPVSAGYLDTSCWNKTGVGPSIAQTMITGGVRWMQSDRDRLSGKIEVHRRLACNDVGEPRLKIFSTCTDLIRSLPVLPLSKTNPEDVDTRADDHAYDALRYMVMSRPVPAAAFGLRGWEKDSYGFNDMREGYAPSDGTFGY